MKVGIDIGSRFVKFAREEGDTIKFNKENSIDFYKNLDFFKEKFKDYKIVTTGYGRHKLNIMGGEVIPELQAHAKGAIFSLGLKDFCLLDIGGQDTKILSVVEERLIDFRTNDKCAASSGRFLENMARVLDMDIEKILDHYEDPISVSATCAIFTESEIIGAITDGIPFEKIAAGINNALYIRIKPWLKELFREKIVLSGGIAKSLALRYFIKNDFPDCEVIVPENSIYIGALGCLKAIKDV